MCVREQKQTESSHGFLLVITVLAVPGIVHYLVD